MRPGELTPAQIHDLGLIANSTMQEILADIGSFLEHHQLDRRDEPERYYEATLLTVIETLAFTAIAGAADGNLDRQQRIATTMFATLKRNLKKYDRHRKEAMQ